MVTFYKILKEILGAVFIVSIICSVIYLPFLKAVLMIVVLVFISFALDSSWEKQIERLEDE